jgi:hypothetical protein
MSYMLLILEPKEQRQSRSPEEGQAAWDSMLRFSEGLQAQGLLKAGSALKSDGVRVEVRGGKSKVVDGPFAESKEIVGGFFLLDCRTREHAIAIANACPAAEWATVEVRQVGTCYE